MTEPVPHEPVDVASVEDPFRVEPPGCCPFFIDPQTGFLSLLSPPGTPPVTSEDVRKLLEDFP